MSTAAAAGEVAREYPDVEILVNNLAVFEPKPFEEISDEDWVRFFQVNVLGGVRLARLYKSDTVSWRRASSVGHHARWATHEKE